MIDLVPASFAGRRRGVELLALAALLAVHLAWPPDVCFEGMRIFKCGGPISGVTVAIAFMAVVAFELVATIYGRLTSRPCPRCGRRVRNGRLDCAACRFDFRSI